MASKATVATLILGLMTVQFGLASGQSAGVQYGPAAKGEYAQVFAHSDTPCPDFRTRPHEECMDGELKFVEMHLDAFVEDLRGVTGSPEELAGLNRADSAWRAYRDAACDLPGLRFRGGTIAGPMAEDCRLGLDRAYMKLLGGTYLISQL